MQINDCYILFFLITGSESSEDEDDYESDDEEDISMLDADYTGIDINESQTAHSEEDSRVSQSNDFDASSKIIEDSGEPSTDEEDFFSL